MLKSLDFGEKIFYWTIMGEAMIVPHSLKTKRNQQIFQDRPKFIFYFLNHKCVPPFYLLIIDFPKFDPLAATGMALCVNLGPKCKILFPLVSD
jgi:hypothetical protein